MEIYIYDKDFKPIELLEGCNSIIWTKRWEQLGDAQLVIATNQIKEFNEYDELIDLYLFNKTYNEYMLIDGYELTYDLQQGELLTIYATDLLDILNRRLVWNQTIVSGSLTHCVSRILNENVIEPTNTNRTIDNFEIGDFTIDTHSIASAQFTGDTVYEAIQKLCDSQDVGYELTIEGDKFVFYLKDHEDLRDYVVFSKEYDNLIGYDKLKSVKNIKNVALVAGEGEGKDRQKASVNDYEGLERREVFVDARDLSSNEGEISEADYTLQLQARGVERLQELSINNSFDATIDNLRMYVYQQDYNLGDFVRIVDYRGNSYTAQITEYIMSENIEGINAYPNFEIKEV